MPQSLARLHVHLIFSTKNRERVLVDKIRASLHFYIVTVREYIAGQQEHHRRKSFQAEYRAFLERHRVAFDDRYVWD
jgi:hypothetical protein